MEPLSAHALLFAWEQGRTRHAVDRALLLRALSAPGVDPAACGDATSARSSSVSACTRSGRP